MRLLRDVVDEIAGNEAIGGGGTLFSVTMELAPGIARSFQEPPAPVLRHLLDRLRHFDMPSSDIRLDRVFAILDRVGIRADWRQGFAEARRVYVAARLVTNIRVEDPDIVRTSAGQEPTWIQPREAFRLWAYGGVIHHEYAKELRWERLGPLAQGPVRQMGHDYASMLLDEGDYLGSLVKSGLEQEIDTLP